MRPATERSAIFAQKSFELGMECGRETFFHPLHERGGVHRLVERLLRHQARKAQAGDERDSLVMAVRNSDAQPSTPSASSAFARQIGGRLFPRIEVELPGKPVMVLHQDDRAQLLPACADFFK